MGRCGKGVRGDLGRVGSTRFGVGVGVWEDTGMI